MKTAATALPNELLSHEREQHHWTQEYVAEQIGAPDPKMVGKWERGVILPTAHYRQKLAALFGKSARELGLVRKDEIPFWHVPYRRNLFFTGRDALLEQLHTALHAEKNAAFTPPHALSGLGGVGKTQTAIESIHLRSISQSGICESSRSSIATPRRKSSRSIASCSSFCEIEWIVRRNSYGQSGP